MASGAQIKYPASVFGYGVDQPEGVSGDVEYFLASATISKGQAVVSAATLDQVTAATTGATGPTVVGFAQSAAVVSQSVPVTFQGRAVGLVATTVTAGNLLGLSATNAGFLAPVTAGVAITQYGDAGKVLGVAEETITTNTTTEVNVRILRL